jgi:chaperonin cofactor prefoldin
VENEDRQSWLLIGIAGMGLALGVIALIVAFNAKSVSNDAASQDSVDEVSTELSNLVDKLGIAEASLTGEQQALQGKAQEQARQSRNAVTNLSNRLDSLERQTAALEKSSKQDTSLNKRVASLEKQVRTLDGQVANLNQRVTKLTKRVNSSGGQAAP